MTERYLLDTGILLALVRGNELGTAIEDRYRLTKAPERPLVSIVTHGEIRVLAARNGWGERKQAALEEALANVVTVDINHVDIIAAYVEFDLVAHRHPNGARNMGKNDLWIAACAKAAAARLLTVDGDFDHLVPDHLKVDRIDPHTGDLIDFGD